MFVEAMSFMDFVADTIFCCVIVFAVGLNVNGSDSVYKVED